MWPQGSLIDLVVGKRGAGGREDAEREKRPSQGENQQGASIHRCGGGTQAKSPGFGKRGVER